MRIIANPKRGTGLSGRDLDDIPMPSLNATGPNELLARCPMYDATPLRKMETLAKDEGVQSIRIKDERTRLNLGSFKALGAAYVLAHLADTQDTPVSETSLNGMTFVTASAGNHGLSVARGAQIFGAQAVIYISKTVPEEFAKRLADQGAQVERVGENYEASMMAAQKAAQDNDWTLLSDSSWAGYTDLPHRLMEGYLTMADEIIHQIDAPPTHIYLQAGVGGMASSIAGFLRKNWHEKPIITVVEPEAAPALFESIQSSKPMTTKGPVSNMGRLDCKEPSLIALKGLSRDADHFMTISDEDATKAQAILGAQGCETSPSGAAGFAGFLASKQKLGVTAQSRVLFIVTETPSE